MFQFKNRSAQRVAAKIAVGMLCFSSACFSNSAGIALLVQGIDAQVVRLIVKARVNGVALSPEEFENIQGQKEVVLGFQLPNAYLGAPVIFDVDGMDSRGCIYQIGTKSTSTDASRRYDLNVDLTLYAAKKSNDNYFAVHGSSSKNVWAVGSAGAAAYWDGCHWRDAANSNGDVLIGVYVPPEPDAQSKSTASAFSISLNQIYKYQDNAWSVDYSPTLGNKMILMGIHGTSATDVWAVATYQPDSKPAMGEPSTLIFHRGANGMWAKDTSQYGAGADVPTYFLRTIFAVSSSNVLVGGSTNNASDQSMNKWALLYWQLGTWRVPAMAPDTVMGQINTIWGTSVNDYWFGGYPHTLRHYLGGTFQPVGGYDAVVSGMTGGPMFHTYRISGSSNNNIWVGSFFTGANPQSRTIRYDGIWKEDMAVETISKQITGQYAAGDRDVWLVGYNGKRIHWDGSSLTEY